MTEALQETPLAKALRASEARWGEFAGWRMPLEFAGVGAEVEAVRRRAGLFDVSHMGELEVAGPGAAAFLDRQLTADVAGLAEGRIRYALLLNAAGGVEDDLLVYRLTAERFLLVVNAANRERDLALLQRETEDGVRVVDRSAEYALLALQGPRATRLLEAASGGALADVRPFGFRGGLLGGETVLFSRTGYTGEDGWEIFCAPRAAPRLWEFLLQSSPDVSPCGLAARDVLRLEAGLLLYGHELTPATTPLMAGLERFIHWEKEFRGREALARQARAGVPARLAGLVMEGRAIPRAGYPVLVEGYPAGTVTSGTFSPTLGKGIALAYLPPAVLAGTPARVEVRGRPHPARVVEPPFYRKEDQLGIPAGQAVHPAT